MLVKRARSIRASLGMRFHLEWNQLLVKNPTILSQYREMSL